jgi:diguanylate cyclase (GGDEF)-like protein
MRATVQCEHAISAVHRRAVSAGNRPKPPQPPSTDATPPDSATRQRLQTRYSYARVVRKLGRPLGLVCVAVGLMTLFGYAIDAEILFRPLKGGPATNPLTSLTILALGSAVLIEGSRHRAWAAPFIAVATLTTGFRLIDGWFSTGFARVLTPFPGRIEAQIAAGQANSMGINTAIMLFLISLSLVLYARRKPVPSQLLAFLALAPPMISLTGYAYGLNQFYGQMSLITTSLGIMLGLSALSLSTHRGVLWAILTPHIGGRIARLQVLFGYLVPLGFGFLLLRSAPFASGENPLGLFIVATSWFIIGLAAVSAVAQESSDRHRRMVEGADHFAAAHDLLTHLPNRRKFFEIGRQEWARIQRNSGNLSILMIDIDHFKRINDTAGHAAGDRVLEAVAGRLANSVRAVDCPTRLGGEEFAVLLPDTLPEGATIVAERIRRQIETLKFDGGPELVGPVTVSIGCASSRGKQTLEEVLSAADGALYEAKGGGRNRTVNAVQR